jgi:hypothetical protein
MGNQLALTNKNMRGNVVKKEKGNKVIDLINSFKTKTRHASPDSDRYADTVWFLFHCLVYSESFKTFQTEMVSKNERSICRNNS